MTERQLNRGSSPHSFSEFYKTAYSLISNSYGFHNGSLDDNIIDTLTETQINQYNLIEMQAFQLSKSIKLKFSRFSQQQIAVALIKVKNILEEMEKLFSSLKVKFLFELFEKLTVCLSMIASLHYNMKNGEATAPTQTWNEKLKNVDQIIWNSSKKIGAKKLEKAKVNKQKNCISSTPKLNGNGNTSTSTSTTTNNLYNLSHKVIQEDNTKRFCDKNKVKLEKKNRLGGISLYNQNYKRFIENRQILIDLTDIIKQHNSRRQFWHELQRDYKETIGIIEQQQFNSKYNKEKTKDQKFKQLSIALHNQQSYESFQKPNDIKEEVNIPLQLSHSLNAQNMISHSQLFCFEANSSNSLQSLEKAIDKVTFVYKNQKFLTLNTIKNLLNKASFFYEQKIKQVQVQLSLQRQRNLQLIAKMKSKSDKCLDRGIQTIWSNTSQGIAQQKLKIEIKKQISIVSNMEEVIMRQNKQLMALEKAKMQCYRRLQLKQKRYDELQKQMRQMKYDNMLKQKQGSKDSYFNDLVQDQPRFENNQNERQISTQGLINAKFSDQSFPKQQYEEASYANRNRVNYYLEPEKHSKMGEQGKKQKYTKSERIIRFQQNQSLDKKGQGKMLNSENKVKRKKNTIIRYIINNGNENASSEIKQNQSYIENSRISNSELKIPYFQSSKNSINSTSKDRLIEGTQKQFQGLSERQVGIQRGEQRVSDSTQKYNLCLQVYEISYPTQIVDESEKQSSLQRVYQNEQLQLNNNQKKGKSYEALRNHADILKKQEYDKNQILNRIIRKEGVRYRSRRQSSLQKWEVPQKGFGWNTFHTFRSPFRQNNKKQNINFHIITTHKSDTGSPYYIGRIAQKQKQEIDIVEEENEQQDKGIIQMQMRNTAPTGISKRGKQKADYKLKKVSNSKLKQFTQTNFSCDLPENSQHYIRNNFILENRATELKKNALMEFNPNLQTAGANQIIPSYMLQKKTMVSEVKSYQKVCNRKFLRPKKVTVSLHEDII